MPKGIKNILKLLVFLIQAIRYLYEKADIKEIYA